MVKNNMKRYIGELYYLFSVLSTPFFGIMSSILIAKYVTPEENGVFMSFFLLLPYVSFLQLGVFNGLNRNISFLTGMGKTGELKKMIQTSKFISYLVAFISLILIFMYGLFQISDYEDYYLFWLSLVTVLIVGFFTPILNHLDVTFRSSQRFKQLGVIRVKESVIAFAMVISVIVLGIYGRFLSLVSKSLSGVFLRKKESPFNYIAKFDKNSYINLLSVGFPLVISGYINSLLSVADKSLILMNLGSDALGEYYLSILIINTLLLIPSSLSTILYPKASIKYGETKNNRGLRSYFWKALGINILVLSIIIVPIYFLIEDVVNDFLPLYKNGIEAAKLTVLSCFTYIYIGPSIIIGIVRKNTIYIIILGLSLFSYWMTGYFLKPTNLIGYVELRFIIYIFISVSVLIYSYYLTTKSEFNE